MKKTVLLHRGRKNEENFQIVSVNGRSWKIMKGVEVQVPDYVAEVLENAQEVESWRSMRSIGC
mgnify:CR=1 FL=1